MTSEAGNHPGSTSSFREQLIDEARRKWVDRLIDLSRRNNLLYYRPLQSGTIELDSDTINLRGLLIGKPLPFDEFAGGEIERPGRLREIGRKALENLEEKGLVTLYLALGKAIWPADDAGRDPEAPVVLVPITFQQRGQVDSTLSVQLNGEAQVNPVLLHVLKAQFNVTIEPVQLLSSAAASTIGAANGSEESEESTLDIPQVLQRLTEKTARVKGFRTATLATIGNFSFQKLSMVNDLENRRADLLANEMVAAIAGDSKARVGIHASQIDPDPRTFDAKPPESEYQVIEADSSQQRAIFGIAAGQCAVVHGPPGTGKSQTITNLIATLTAAGKKVLFVAEKRAALEVVMNRLKGVGLDHLAIDLHGADRAPKRVMEQVSRTLEYVRNTAPPVVGLLHQQFTERRTRLNGHDKRMHTPLPPTGKSVFELQASLLRIPANVNSHVRLRGADLTQISPERAECIRSLLDELAGMASLFTRTDSSPWNGFSVERGEQAQELVDCCDLLRRERLPRLVALNREVSKVSGLRVPSTKSDVGEMIALLSSVSETLGGYHEEIWMSPLSSTIETLSPAARKPMKVFWLKLTSPGFRAVLRDAMHLHVDGKVAVSTLLHDLKVAAKGLEAWQRWSTETGSSPRLMAKLTEYKQAFADVLQSLSILDEGKPSSSAPNNDALGELLEEVTRLSSDQHTPYRLLRLSEIERELASLGGKTIMEELRSGEFKPDSWSLLFDRVWLTSALDQAAALEPQTRGFVGTTHSQTVEEFKRYDASRLKLAADRVRLAHAERTIAAMNEHPDQEHLIRAEAAKTRRHKPLRHIFRQASEVMTAVCPCLMTSPLSVSQLIDSTGVFDYVIFDEASQVLPEDAIPAILRGRHLIVAGDNKQLPPTTFFSAGADDEDPVESESEGYESLLDMMIPFAMGFHLNWHYRSRDEALIAFSNHHIYDDRLVTFPSPSASSAVRHVLVTDQVMSDGQEESSGAEVERVVQLVLEHARARPDRTLGVITMGMKHASRIQALLDRTLPKHSELHGFFNSERHERFFVKNLERVQGDERDDIILSVGYGKDRGGNLPLRFGPILSASGRRRLNVAVTRARRSMTVVSSFAAADIDSTKVRPGTGLEFLRQYLDYAATEGQVMSRTEATNEPMNDFEADVFEALSVRGIKLVPQVGCSHFRIDLAALHPDEPGRFVLAIECDGATYHSSYTARDRDRLRQQQLENLGWTFHRIWSTDWFLRKEEEVSRAVGAFEKAVAATHHLATEDFPFPALGRVPNGEPTAAQQPTGRIPPQAPISRKANITDYSFSELSRLLTWVRSDGKLRTNDELADEMFAALPFSRRGARIDEALRQIIARSPNGKR